MKAVWYESTGPAREVLRFGEVETPRPGPGEVRVRVAASGVNPSDTKKRGGWIGMAMAHPRVIPHSDGAGTVEAVGEGVDPGRIGERAWVWNAQGGGRPFGTAAEFVVVPDGRIAGGLNPGRKSRKVLQDCTICVSCRCTGPCWTVPRKRENRA